MSNSPSAKAAPPSQPTKPRRWRRRLGKWLFGSLLAIVLLLGGLLTLGIGLLSNEGGLRWSVAQLKPWLPGELEIDRLDGHLFGQLAVDKLRYTQTDGLAVQLAELRFDWHPGALWQRRLQLERLQVRGLELQLPPAAEQAPEPPPEKAEPLSLPDVQLPIAVHIEHVALADIRVLQKPAPQQANLNKERFYRVAAQADIPATADTAPLFQLDKAELALRLNRNGQLTLERLQVALPELELNTAGQATLRGDYPLDIQLDWYYAGSDLPRLDGQGQLTGSIADLVINQRLTGPVTAQLDANLQEPLGKRRWQAQLALQIADLSQLPAAGLPPGKADLELQARGDDQRMAAELTGRVRETPTTFGEWDLTTELAFDVSALQLTLGRLALHQADAPGSLRLSGTADLAGELPQLRLTGLWQQLAWPLGTAQPTVTSDSGGLVFTGTPDDYQLSVQTRLAGAQIPAGWWQLEAQGSTEAVTLERLQGELLNGKLTLAGQAQWAPQVDWQLELSGEALDPGVKYPALPGQLDFRITSEGQLGQTLQARTRIDKLTGELADYPVSGQGSVAIAGDTIRVEALALRSGEAELQAAGQLAETAAALDWSLNVPDMAKLVPGATGQIAGRGQIGGGLQAPQVTSELTVTGLAIAGLKLARLTSDIDVDLGNGGQLDLMVEAADLAVAEQQIRRIQLQGEGAVDAHRLTLDVTRSTPPDSPDTAADTLHLALAGGYQAPAWMGHIEALTVDSRLAGEWRLREPAALRAGPEQARLQDFCWQRRAGAICLEGHWQPTGGQAEVNLSDLELAWAEPFLPPTLTLLGKLGGRIQASLGEQPTATAELHLDPGALRYTETGAKPLEFALGPAKLAAEFGTERVQIDADLAVGERSRLQAVARLPRTALQADPMRAPLDGRIQLAWDDTDKLQWLVEDFVERVDLQAQGDLTLAGQVGQPRITGTTEITGQVDDIKDLGIDLKPVTLQIRGTGSDYLDIQGELVSAGKLRLDGRITLDSTQGWPTYLAITGERVQVADQPRMRVWITPALRIGYRPELLTVAGELTVPILSLEPKEIPPGAKQASADVVMADAPPPEPAEPPMPIDADIRLTLGERVRFRGFGLDAKLGGSLRVAQKPGENAIATGTLRIREGAYTAYGQDLRIENGRLMFAGTSVDNPGLDIRAVREAEEVVAGVKISGVAKNPELSLFSQPPMNQADALSYLLTGKPLRGTSDEEQESLNAAAAGMSAAGGLLANDLRRRLGFEELQFQGGEDVQSSSILLGRYLTPRLYMSYDVGLTGKSEEVKLRYELTERWALETASGEETGGDVIYTIELD